MVLIQVAMTEMRPESAVWVLVKTLRSLQARHYGVISALAVFNQIIVFLTNNSEIICPIMCVGSSC